MYRLINFEAMVLASFRWGGIDRRSTLPYRIWSFWIKRYECKNPLCTAFQGYSRSSEPTRIDGLPVTSYQWSIVTMADLVSLTISVDNRKLFYPRVFTSPLRGLPLDYFKAGWSQKLEWCPYQTYENFDDICMRIWTQHRNVPDRQADRNGISIARAACLCTLVRDEN